MLNMAGRTLNIKQVQEILDISERTIFRLIRKGELKGFKVGREWRFEESDIEDFIALQRQKAEQEALQQKFSEEDDPEDKDPAA
jgi:excisionase family DNA binding protein